jgi:hypothetical protein
MARGKSASFLLLECQSASRHKINCASDRSDVDRGRPSQRPPLAPFRRPVRSRSIVPVIPSDLAMLTHLERAPEIDQIQTLISLLAPGLHNAILRLDVVVDEAHPGGDWRRTSEFGSSACTRADRAEGFSGGEPSILVR